MAGSGIARLLGSGGARRAADALKGRKSRIDAAIDEATGSSKKVSAKAPSKSKKKR